MKCRELIHSLPELNYVITNYIFHFITQVSFGKLLLFVTLIAGSCL